MLSAPESSGWWGPVAVWFVFGFVGGLTAGADTLGVGGRLRGVRGVWYRWLGGVGLTSFTAGFFGQMSGFLRG